MTFWSSSNKQHCRRDISLTAVVWGPVKVCHRLPWYPSDRGFLCSPAQEPRLYLRPHPLSQAFLGQVLLLQSFKDNLICTTGAEENEIDRKRDSAGLQMDERSCAVHSVCIELIDVL